MKKRDIVLLVVLSCGAIAVLLALAAFCYVRRRRRKREDDEDGTSCAIRIDQSSGSDGGGEKKSRLNGFLNLKTPLISTKTLGRRGGAAGYHSQRLCRDPPARPQSNYYEYESAPPRRPGKLSHYH